MISADDFNAKQEQLMLRLEAQRTFLIHLADLAEKALATHGNPSEKWEANAELMQWFRSDPIRVIELAQAATAWALRPGGTTSQRLIQATGELQGSA